MRPDLGLFTCSNCDTDDSEIFSRAFPMLLSSFFCHSDLSIQRLDVRECFHRGLHSRNGRKKRQTFMHWMCVLKILKYDLFGVKRPLVLMPFKHFIPNFERARTFIFVQVHILDVRGRAIPATPTFGCERRNGKRPTMGYIKALRKMILSNM